jgi:hypothetical protein
LSVVITHLKPGTGRNIIFTGHANGDIMVWCSQTLDLLYTVQVLRCSKILFYSILFISFL